VSLRWPPRGSFLAGRGEHSEQTSEADHLDGPQKVCTSWRRLLHADPVHGRRALRDLRIDRVPVRQDDRGR
jgi:hypothetical protein